MNRFVQRFLVLPILVLTLTFAAGFLTACSCATPSRGSSIAIKLFYQPDKKTPIAFTGAANKKLFANLVHMFNQELDWVFPIKHKITKLEKKVSLLITSASAAEKKVATSFLKAFTSSKNNRFYQATLTGAKVNSPLLEEEWLKVFVPQNNRLSETKNIDFQLFFQTVDGQQRWKLDIRLLNVAINIKNKTIEVKLGNDFAVLSVANVD